MGRPVLATALAAAFIPACKNGDVKAPAPTPTTAGLEEAAVVLRPPGREVPIRVEVARTEEERARGLMYRQAMATDAGMLFIFPRAGRLSFWMRNTFIPLDMIFIGEDRRIVGIVENAEPRTETSRAVEGISRFVLEVNGGLAARLGLAAGQVVDFRNVGL